MTEANKAGNPPFSGEVKDIWWLEAGKEFGSTGYYYAYSLGSSSGNANVPASSPLKCQYITFNRFMIRDGLLIGVEEAWPKDHLLPAIVSIQAGLHTNVRRNHENRNEIRLTKSEFGEGATLRISTVEKSGGSPDLFVLRRQRQNGEVVAEKKPTIFISYSHKDECYRDRLCISLQSLVFDGKIETWHDQKMLGGDDFENVIAAMMKNADIILLLLSPDFIASEYCTNKEVPLALDLHKEGKTKCKPILLRDCDWKGKPYSHLNFIHTGGQPLCKASQPDEAYQLILDDLKAELSRGVRSQIGVSVSLRKSSLPDEITPNQNSSGWF